MGLKRYCIWCESNGNHAKGWYWIHEDCFQELCDFVALGKDIYKKFQQNGTITKEELEGMLKTTAEFQKMWHNQYKKIIL